MWMIKKKDASYQFMKIIVYLKKNNKCFFYLSSWRRQRDKDMSFIKV